MEHCDVNMNPNCLAHQDALARIEEKLESIDSRLDRLNGAVARHEGEIVTINLRAAKEEGRRGGIGTVGMVIVTLGSLLFAGWSSVSASHQAAAAIAQMQANQPR